MDLEKALLPRARATLTYLLVGLCAQARALSSIVAFGDSLTDAGGAHGASALVDSTLYTNMVRPAVPAYAFDLVRQRAARQRQFTAARSTFDVCHVLPISH